LDFEKQKEGGRSFSMFIFTGKAFGDVLREKGAGPLLICPWEVVMVIAPGE
jgi:hypothetical protein